MITDLFLSDEWHFITPDFNSLPWKPEWLRGLTPKVARLTGKKVWEMTWEQAANWEDTATWLSFFKKATQRVSGLTGL